MDNSQINDLADRISQLVSNGPGPVELSKLQSSIDDLSARLRKLESAGPAASAVSHFHQHSSQDRFNIIEAIADSVFPRDQKEKACQFEPDKPCDHCSMCSSRGF